MINSQENQTLLDLALQEYGSIEGLFSLMEANDYSDVTRDISPYETIVLQGDVIDRNIFNYYTNNSIRPATAATQEELCLEGIGAMTIGNDFVIR